MSATRRARRAAWVCAVSVGILAVSACLEPGKPYLSPRDTDPPELVEMSPPAGGTIEPNGFIELVFSEPMDPRSLRPGLYIVRGAERIPTTVLIPEPREDVPLASQQVDSPYQVRVQGEVPLRAGTRYNLVFDEVLTDTAGNQLVGQDGGAVQPPVPFGTTP